MSAAAKVIERVKSSFDHGASYEALQSLKTAYYRFAARKQPEEARTVLLEGALLMLARQEVTCATELGRMLVDALTQQATAAGGDGAAASAASDADGICRVLAGFAALPAPADGSAPAAAVDAQVDEVGRFAMEAVKWAQRSPSVPAPTVARMHDLYAEYVTRAAGWRRLGTAAAHYCRGADAGAFAMAVAAAAAAAAAAASSSSSPEQQEEEQALFPARAALQTLACARGSARADRAAHAAAFLQAYPAARRKAGGGKGGDSGDGLPDAPVCRFAEMFVELLANQAAAAAAAAPRQQQQPSASSAGRQVSQLLRQKYAPCLAAPDPSLAVCAARAERVWFGAPPGTGGGGLGGGLLGGLLQGLLGDDGDDDDE